MFQNIQEKWAGKTTVKRKAIICCTVLFFQAYSTSSTSPTPSPFSQVGSSSTLDDTA